MYLISILLVVENGEIELYSDCTNDIWIRVSADIVEVGACQFLSCHISSTSFNNHVSIF
jgi:hypothetical protein